MKHFIILLIFTFNCYAQVAVKLNSGENIFGIIKSNDPDTLGVMTFENIYFKIPKPDIVSTDKIKSQIVIKSGSFYAHITRCDSNHFYMVGESGFEFKVLKKIIRSVTFSTSWSVNHTYDVIEGDWFRLADDYKAPGFVIGIFVVLFAVITAFSAR